MSAPTAKGTPDRRRVGRRSRQKGRTWEQVVVRLLKPIFGDGVHRGHQRLRGHAGGGEGCDIEGSPYYAETRHEAEYGWRTHLLEALEARAARNDPRPIVLIAKEDKKPKGWKVGQPGRPPVAIMLLDEWLELVKLAHGEPPPPEDR